MEDILRKLVAFPSVTGDHQAGHELIEYVADYVRNRGMHIERYIANGYESLVATSQAQDKKPRVMFAVHGDVVAANPEQFELQLRDGRYYGRGVLDMKGSLASFLQVIDDIHPNMHEYSLGLVITLDEETGGKDSMPQLIAEGYRPKVVILPDGGDNWHIQTASKGLWIFNIIATGKSCHGSRHWEGENAIYKLLPIISELRALFPDQGPDTNTMSLNIFKAGRSMTQVPDKASFSLEVRTLTAAEHTRLGDAIKALCTQYGLEYRIDTDALPTSFSLEDPLIKPYADIMSEVIGRQVEGIRTFATNDIRYWAPAGASCISFYPEGNGHHSPSEWIDQKALEQMHSINARYVELMAHL